MSAGHTARMKGILYIASTALGGWLGWALGSRIGFFGAFVLSTIGTGVGLYFAIRVTRSLLP
jgi:hypothetical protein